MPILGIWASQISGHLYSNSYEAIATSTISTTGEFSFTSIPNTYKHLQLRMLLRGTYAATLDSVYVRLNGDTSTNYNGHVLQGDGATASAGNQGSTNYGLVGVCSSASATSNMFGVLVVDILNYANTNKYKTIRGLSGADLNGSGQIRIQSALWQNTNAISSIYVGGFNNVFASNSTVALYGVK